MEKKKAFLPSMPIFNPKKREKKLIERALSSYFSSIGHPIIITDISLIVKSINPVGTQLLLKGKENVATPLHKLLPSITSKSLKDGEGEIIINSNPYSFTSVAYTDKKGVDSGYLINLYPLDGQHNTKREPQTSQSQLELAVTAAGLDLWEVDLTTGVRSGGLRIIEGLGYKINTTLNSLDKLFNLIHPNDLPTVKERIESHLKGVTDIYSCEFRLKDASGKYQWVANYGKVTQWTEQGVPEYMLGLSLNINERKLNEARILRQNEALKLSNAEKDKFFSIIAHDLKGPFQGFIGFTEILTTDTESLTHEEIQEIAKSLRSNAKNLYELLENLLGWAQIKRGHKRFNPEKINLSSITKTVTDQLSLQLTSKEIKLENQIPPKLVLLADQESLRTILRNLISNAIKFSHAGGRIGLSTKPLPKGMVEISIEDQGIGMDENLKNKLFAVDQKVSRLGTANEPSTGLGLILCKELIGKHGGSIAVDSTPEHGSTFRFTIPAATL